MESFARSGGTEGRFTDAQLDAARTQCDSLADAAFPDILRQRSPTLFDGLTASVAAGSVHAKRLWDHVHTVPSWADEQSMKPAFDVALKNVVPAGLALLGGSLVESYASANGAKVLTFTNRLNTNASQRVYETAHFVNEIAACRGAFPQRLAHRIMVEVRLIHARVRFGVWKGDWNAADWGEPINQEDYAGTVLMFSHVYRRSLQLLGVKLSDEERAANQLIWRYNAHLLGVDPDLICSDLSEEQALYNAITRRQFHPDDDSRMLTDAVLRGMAFKPPFALPPSVLFSLARACVGETLGDDLGLSSGRFGSAVAACVKPTTQIKSTLLKPFSSTQIWVGGKFADGILKFGLGHGYRSEFGRSD